MRMFTLLLYVALDKLRVPSNIRSMNVIRPHLHEVYTEEINKITGAR